MAKPKILMMTDNPLIHTGMAVVMREISLRLHATGRYDVVIGAWGYNGYPHQFPMPIIPLSAADFGRGGHPHAGIMGLDGVVEMVKPDILWALGDAWMINYINEMRNRKSFKFVQYTPIDGHIQGGGVPANWGPWLSGADQLVMYSQYGADQLKKSAPNINTELIYHGVKSDVYKPVGAEVKAQLKRQIVYWRVRGNELVQEQGLPDDVFIVGTVARNQPRKNFDKILKSFALFSKNKPNARLWLHSALQDAAYSLADLAKVFGIEDKVCFTPRYNLVNGLTENDMNMLFNLFDIHLLPTQGEGFGLPILETMSSGVPQVVTNYSAHVEWCKPASELIPVSYPDDFITGIPHPVERAIPKPTETAKCLDRIFYDKKYHAVLSQRAREIAESMSWDKTIPQWETVFNNVLSGRSNVSDTVKKDTFEIVKI
jgi:glycosyltransferase involved in cell wall biosynthesis